MDNQSGKQGHAYKIQVFDVIVMANVAIFALMFLLGGFDVNASVLIKFGAKFNYKIVQGEWWRLITPMFLHVDLMHLMFNTLGVISLSQPLKHIFGLKKLLAIYLLAGISGVVMSFAFSNSLSAGASTAIFGMLGTHVYLYKRHPKAYRYIFGTQFLALIGINFIYGFVVSGIDNFGHLGGFIGGFLVAYALGVASDALVRKQLLALPLLVCVLLSGVFYGFQRYHESADYYLMHVIDAVESNQYEEAYRRLIQGLEKYPDDPKLNDLLKNAQ